MLIGERYTACTESAEKAFAFLPVVDDGQRITCDTQHDCSPGDYVVIWFKPRSRTARAAGRECWITVRFREPGASSTWSAILFETRDEATAFHRASGEPGMGKAKD